MKLSIALLAALSLSTSISGYAVHRESSQELSLLARGPPVVVERPPPEAHDPIPVPVPPEVKPGDENKPGGGILASGIATFQNIKAAIQQLPRARWVSYVISKAKALQRLLLSRPAFQGNPKDLIETEADGYPLTAKGTDLTEHVKKLKEVPYSGGRLWTWSDHNEEVREHDLNTGQIVPVGFVYSTKYFSPRDAVDTFIVNGRVLDRDGEDFVTLSSIGEKRSVSLGDLNGPTNPNAAADTSSATFEQYLMLFYAAQTTVQTAIRPILNNITSQTNSTLVHQMADSIYYDLTGSTTALIGPFNYGMSFTGNVSTKAGADKNSNTTDTTAFITMVESIYTGMWTSAFYAANSTGVYEQMLAIASVLDTNDTSVYPANWLTVP